MQTDTSRNLQMEASADDIAEGSLAWITEAIGEGLPEPQVTIQTMNPGNPQHPHQKSRLWLDQWHLLLKREAIAASEVASCLNSGIIPPKSVQIDELEQATSQLSIPQLKRKAWSQLTSAKDAVLCVKQQLSHAANTPAYVSSLTTKIDKVDQLLSSFHTWNTPAMASLEQQASRLEEDVFQAALLLEEDQLMGDACVVLHAAGPSAAAGGSSTQALGSGVRSDESKQARRSAPGTRRQTADTTTSGRRSMRGVLPARRTSMPGAFHRPPEPTCLTYQPSSAASGRGSYSACSSKVSKGHGCLAPEVVAYDEFMLEHGEWGGWDEQDHKEFESILRSCGSDYVKAVEVAMDQCVGFTRAELMQHARWHMDYTDLLVRKRMAVAAWRVHRDQMRAQAQAKAALLAPEPSLVPAVQARAEQAAAGRAAAHASREAAIKKELVASWKQRREDVARQAAERAAQAARQAAERKELEVSERQHLNKMRLHLFKDLKTRAAEETARKAAMAAEEERVLRAVSSNQVAATLAQRNQSLLSRRHELCEVKRAQAQKREQVQQQLLDKVHVEAPADPNRLLKGTAAHMARVNQTRQEDRSARDSGFILQVSHRQQVSWRAGLQGNR